MRKIISLLIAAAMIAAMLPTLGLLVSAETAEGEAPERDRSWYSDDATSFTITTPAQLLGFSDLLASGTTFAGKTVKLGADIDLNPNWTANATAPANKWADVTAKHFGGTFDGDGHRISGIYLSSAAESAGIFGIADDGATLKNLVIDNSYVSIYKTSGALFAWMTAGTVNITNVYCDVDVTASNQYCGGFMGRLYGGTLNISNCVYAGDFVSTHSGRNYDGGFVGSIAHSSYSGGAKGNAVLNISNSAFYGTIKAKEFGGIVGEVGSSGYGVLNATNCIIAGDIVSLGYTCGSFYAKAINGKNYITLTNCYYTELLDYDTVEYQAYPEGQPTPAEDSSFKIEDAQLIETLENLSKLTGFTAIENGYPRPTTMVEMTDGIYDRITSWYDSTKDSFELSTAQQLLGFSDLLAADTTFTGKTITLGADIDLNKGWTVGASAPANRWADVSDKKFGGNFNGEGNIVSGIYLASTATNSTAIFGIALDGTVVEELSILNSYVSATSICGGLFAYMTAGTVTVENVYCDVDLTFSGQQGGGFMGWLYGGTFNVNNCVYAGDIIGTKAGTAYIGGFVGYTAHQNYTAEAPAALNISNSAFYGSASGRYVGGIIGRMGHSVNCYTTATITDCIVAGNVNNTDTVGYCGAFYGGTQSASVNTVTITDCYYTESTDNGELKDQPIGSSEKEGEAQQPTEGSTYTKAADDSLRGINAMAPNGFVSMPEGYAMPMGVVNMVAGMKHVSRDTALDGFETAYVGYQQSTTDLDLRLVGIVNVMGADSTLADEYKCVGFDIVMTTESGKQWSNKVNGELPVITTAYTAVLEAGKETPTDADALGGDYIFVATVDGIKANVGTLTFVVKTFHDSADGVRVYDDVYVISYDTGAVVEAE